MKGASSVAAISAHRAPLATKRPCRALVVAGVVPWVPCFSGIVIVVRLSVMERGSVASVALDFVPGHQAGTDPDLRAPTLTFAAATAAVIMRLRSRPEPSDRSPSFADPSTHGAREIETLTARRHASARLGVHSGLDAWLKRLRQHTTSNAGSLMADSRARRASDDVGHARRRASARAR